MVSVKALASMALLCSCCVWAQSNSQRVYIEVDTNEGLLLQQITEQQDASKKKVLLSKFASLFPKHEGMAWVNFQLQELAAADKAWDDVIALGRKVMALDPTAVESAHASLKAAEAKKDSGLVLEWAKAASAAARKLQKSTPPLDPDEVEAWKLRLDFAKQADEYTEYALFQASQFPDADVAKKAEILSALSAINSHSVYIEAVTRPAAAPTRTASKEFVGREAVAVAEKAFQGGTANLDMVLLLADYYMNRERKNDKALLYSAKLVDVANVAPKPDGLPEAEWAKKRSQALMTGYWNQGMIHMQRESYGAADRFFRAAVPYLTGNDHLRASALYYLGYINYRMAEAGERIRIRESVKSYEQCAAIKSPVQAQAQKNLEAIKAEYNMQP